MLRAIHAKMDLKSSRRKPEEVVNKSRDLQLVLADSIVAEGFDETLTCYRFPRRPGGIYVRIISWNG